MTVNFDDIRWDDHPSFDDWSRDEETDKQIDNVKSRMNWYSAGCGCCSYGMDVDSKEDKIKVILKYLTVLEVKRQEMNDLLIKIQMSKPEEHIGLCSLCYEQFPMPGLEAHIEECDGPVDK